MKIKFPPDFLWGAATSSYQIEGGADEDGRKKSIWDHFCQIPGKIVNGETGDVAADHYHRWKEDFAIMAGLGIQAYRFSLAWPRIIPEGVGKVNPAGLAFYDKLIDELLTLGIEPAITLYHWDLPQPLQDKGGWASRETIDAFTHFAAVSFKRFNDRVKLWITHNEPCIVARFGYWKGYHAPGIADPIQGLAAGHHIMLSHGTAMEAMRSEAPASFKGKIGITLNLSPVFPEDPAKEDDRAAAKFYDAIVNRFYLDSLFKGAYPKNLLQRYPQLTQYILKGDMEKISLPIDFIGINYYSRSVVRGEGPADAINPVSLPPPANPYSQMWEYYPQGMGEVIEDVWTNYSPKEIYITENGTSVDDKVSPSGQVKDQKRITFLKANLHEVQKKINASIPVKGYFVWSLLDNFEWTFGYQRRFGIVYVDFKTQERIIKASGLWYGKVIKQNGFII